MKIPENLKGKNLYEFLLANKSLIMDAKKATIKRADGISFKTLSINDKGELCTKAGTINPVPESATKLKAALVINTTNWFDSHKDVHIPGLWKKSLSETVNHYLVKEHVMAFENIISTDIKAYTKQILWSELGVKASGYTEALIYEANIEKDRNPFMFEQYRKNYVKNHSVGMRYVKIQFAFNDEDYKEEFAVWNKYVDLIANKQDAEEAGYFYAVTEAKSVEGSAVVIGSNTITPTYSIEELKNTSTQSAEPVSATPNEPQKSINWEKLSALIN